LRNFSKAVGIGRSAIDEICDNSAGVLDVVKARRFSRTSGSSSTLTWRSLTFYQLLYLDYLTTIIKKKFIQSIFAMAVNTLSFLISV
jgi:hypothetical protein